VSYGIRTHVKWKAKKIINLRANNLISKDKLKKKINFEKKYDRKILEST
jgi:hypothetical protein